MLYVCVSVTNQLEDMKFQNIGSIHKRIKSEIRASKRNLLKNTFSMISKLYTHMYVCTCMLCHFSHVWLFVTVLTVAPQAPLSKGFSRQEYWSGLPVPPPGDRPDPEIKPAAPVAPDLQADS